MGWVLMSERDLKRVEILAQLDDGHIGVTTAGHLMNISARFPKKFTFLEGVF